MLRELLLTALPLLAPAQEPAAPEPAAPLAVDGVPVAWDDFAQWLLLLQGPANVEEFVLEHLLQRRARELGVELREEELAARVDGEIEERVRLAFEGDRAAWAAELERLGQTPEVHRVELLRDARRASWTDVLVAARREVDAEEVRELWEDRYGVGGRQLSMSLLYLKVVAPPQPPGTTREENVARNAEAKRETLARASALHGELAQRADFASLVREHSEDEATRARGGALDGPFSVHDFPGVPAQALTELEVGEVLEPFLSRGGACLLRLDGERITPLEAVEAELREELRRAPANRAEADALWESLRGEAAVEVLPELTREPGPDDPRHGKAVLVVDGETISRLHFSRWLVPRRGRPLMRTFVQHRMVKEMAVAAGVDVDALEVKARVNDDLEAQIQAFFEGDRQAWLAHLAADGRTPASAERVARIRTAHALRAERLMLAERVIGEDDLRREWVERYGEAGSSLDLRYILLRLPEPPAEGLEDEAAREAWRRQEGRACLDLLASLRARALEGEDFGALAQTYSQEAASAERGGRPPGRVELHTWPEAVQGEVRRLRVGELSSPIDFGGGDFLLCELAGVVVVPFEEVQAELRRDLEARRPTQVEISAQVNAWTRELVVEPLPGMYPESAF